MKLLLATMLGLALAGCGTTTEGSPPASSAPMETTGVTDEADSPVKPPEIALVSAAGKQVAKQGSYCVISVDPSSGQSRGQCADSMWPHPDRVTVVHPGDGVSVVLSDAQVRKEGSVTVLPFGCEQTVVETIRLNPGEQSTAFAVDLEPGAYELQVFARFKAGDRLSGDVSGGLGLVVAPDTPPAIEPGPPRRSNC
jgi:hypothetical protein